MQLKQVTPLKRRIIEKKIFNDDAADDDDDYYYNDDDESERGEFVVALVQETMTPPHTYTEKLIITSFRIL